ncbi:hypothetical protein RND71_040318 [Anisodus tanguticus]|uniref:Uncharacterized protein n=1 Tax=Anisodus tanguticus TaxID=243964 RepID=A0AAE1QSR1_9SOLA|nr:hypothetical protein RND71_040318 [Anisodus tanguticus]
MNLFDKLNILFEVSTLAYKATSHTEKQRVEVRLDFKGPTMEKWVGEFNKPISYILCHFHPGWAINDCGLLYLLACWASDPTRLCKRIRVQFGPQKSVHPKGKRKVTDRSKNRPSPCIRDGICDTYAHMRPQILRHLWVAIPPLGLCPSARHTPYAMQNTPHLPNFVETCIFRYRKHHSEETRPNTRYDINTDLYHIDPMKGKMENWDSRTREVTSTYPSSVSLVSLSIITLIPCNISNNHFQALFISKVHFGGGQHHTSDRLVVASMPVSERGQSCKRYPKDLSGLTLEGGHLEIRKAYTSTRLRSKRFIGMDRLSPTNYRTKVNTVVSRHAEGSPRSLVQKEIEIHYQIVRKNGMTMDEISTQ